jgi:phage virion morphogenesis protein
VTAATVAHGAQGRFELIDAEVRAALQRLKDRGEDLREPLRSLGFTWKERIALAFHDQTDPWGYAWRPLRPRTLKRRRDQGRSGVSILRDIGLLLGSRAFRTTARTLDLLLGNSNRPVAIHQFGGRAGRNGSARIPARPMMPIRGNGEIDLPPDWRDELVDVIGAHLEPSP